MAKSSSTERAGLPGQATCVAEDPGGPRLGGGDAPIDHPVLAAWKTFLDQFEGEIPLEGQYAITALDATLQALVSDARGADLDAVRFRTLVRESRIESDEEGNVRLVALMPPLPNELRTEVQVKLLVHLGRDERTIVRLVDHLRGSRA